MDVDALLTELSAEAQDRLEVLDQTVHAGVRVDAHQMDGLARFLGRVDRFDHRLVAREPRAACLGDADRLLIDHAPGAELPETEIAEADPCLLLFTSGTTGRPKGAQLTHRGCIHNLLSLAFANTVQPMALAKVRGVDKGVARGVLGERILEAVAEGVEANWRPPRTQKRRDDGRDLRPAVALVAAWVNQIARDRQLDPTLLATRADVEALVRGDDDARLAHGWRAETAGGPITRLVSGDAALAFDGGNVVLEERSHTPVV